MAGKLISLMDALNIGELINKIHLLNSPYQEEIEYILKSSEFRNISQKKDQIRYIKSKIPKINILTLANMFNISESTVWRTLKNEGKTNDQNAKEHYRNKALFTIQEENEIIEYISHRQEMGDCPTSEDVRIKAQKMYFEKTGENHSFSRSWWHEFKKRHADTIATGTVKSMEDVRNDPKPEDVQRYLADLLGVLPGLVSGKQIINMDETGFSVRANKGKKKKCVYIRNHRKPASFRDKPDANHVSMAATINLMGESLKPFLITTTNVISTQKLSLLTDEYEWFKTKKGYMTKKAMIEWVKRILAPYSNMVRRELNDIVAKIVLIMDNFGCHSDKEVLDEMNKIGNIEIVWLPPHTSHLFQPLDLFPFGELKRIYYQTTTEPTKPLVVGKIIHILKAWHAASFKANIKVAWSRAGIDLTKGNVIARLDFSTFTRIMRAHCINMDEYLDVRVYDWDETDLQQ